MRKIMPILVALCLIGIGLFMLNSYFKNEPRKPTPVISETAGPEAMAKQWIEQKAWTYLYDGSNLQLQGTTKTDCPTCYAVVYTFESAHGGYGDRRIDAVLTQVITPHTIKVSVEGTQVVAAVTDGIFDELNQKLIKKNEQVALKVYFANSQKDPAMMDCSKVYPTTRTVEKTLSVARRALEELLQGPTEQEKSQGFLTTINSNVTIKSVAIANGVATVDFDKKFSEGVGGSCRVVAIRAQITETLRQFATVKNVIISVEGRTEGVLEP